MKKIIAAILGFLFFPISSLAFVDADRGAVNRLVERGIITDSKFFYPEKKCTRGQFVEWAIKNINENGDKKGVEPFLDISKKNKFFPFVAEAWALGVLDDKKVFLPARPITKFDAVKIAILLEGVAVPRAKFHKADRFLDLKNHFEKAIAQKALEMRIVREKSAKLFGKTEKLSRLQCAKILDAIALRRASETLKLRKEISKNQKTVLDEVEFLIEHKFYPPEKVDSKKLVAAGAKGMTEALGDPHSVFFTEEETKSFLAQVGFGTEYGIGAQVGTDEKGRTIIIKPLRGSPAEAAGLLPGDVVSKVDGEDVLGEKLPLEAIVKKIKGENGTPVEIEFLRHGRKIVKKIIRAPILAKSTFAYPSGKYLVIEVDYFGEKTPKEIAAAIEKYKTNAKNGVILDLRNDPGGLLRAAIEVLGEFLPPGSVAVKTVGVDTKSTRKTRDDGKYADLPLVVLMNRFSASASEIVAGAIQDHRRGVVIGEQSFGKGTAQDFFPFSDGSALKLTIAEWHTPNDRAIDGVGITPDFPFSAIDDDQKALKYAAKIFSRNQWKK